jgi:DNA-binding response OmpR family regulator
VKKKVMVVDDEQEIVDFLEKFLNRFNISVIKATGGGEALDLYQSQKPNYIFLDIQMPDKNGLTLLKELMNLDSQLKIIMITGKDDKDHQEKAKELGALDYITKPLDLNELSEKIEQYIL